MAATSRSTVIDREAVPNDRLNLHATAGPDPEPSFNTADSSCSRRMTRMGFLARHFLAGKRLEDSVSNLHALLVRVVLVGQYDDAKAFGGDERNVSTKAVG